MPTLRLTTSKKEKFNCFVDFRCNNIFGGTQIEFTDLMLPKKNRFTISFHLVIQKHVISSLKKQRVVTIFRIV